ncbi:Ulp1 protease family C-terminal catalytic domain [Arabidopsis thaliana x Arabidopsis arenosa]|uniref:Ulp1 protease family C-terminal catalytic domain n=1 Tax=Arabidopsis thaliana x Arabidopsis arenosa TaxID=1240361 RepID=A0A8T1Z1X7_9BRAS|nr:Ulp1 protease family C-terminal catalytic domain [Arabidopsis thaliana x Arabidopsis arenosa]
MDGNKPNDVVSRKKHTQEGPEKDKGELRVSPRRKLPPTKPPEELGSTSVAPTEDLIVEELPPRLFALDRYPSKTKMNAYSKPEYISDIAEVLKGKAEMQMLLDSPFGYLFGIPANKCSFSGKLVLGLICRQLVTKKVNEMWMVFGGHPIKFGLREFSIVTGLECGVYPKKKEVEAVLKVKPGCKKVWDALFVDRFGENATPLVQDLVAWLKEDKSMDGWKQLALSLIILVDGVIACGKNPIRPQDTTVEMTKNVKFFLKYPWGRLSFTRTLERIANFQTPSDVKKLIRCVKDGSYALQGFPLALQLFAFETIPSLAKLAPDDEANRTFTQRSIHHLASLRPIRTSSILACEAAEEVEVTYLVKPDDNICPPSLSWDDEVEDPRVAYIERLMLAGHEWQEEEWVGGSAAFPKQERPPQLGEIHVKKRKRNVRGPNAPVLKKQKSVVEDENEETAEDCSEDPQFEKFVVELRRCFRRQEAQNKQMQEDLKNFVRQEIRAALDPKGKKTEPTQTSHASPSPTKSVVKAPITVKKASKRMSTKKVFKSGTRKSSRLNNIMTSAVQITELSDVNSSSEEDDQVEANNEGGFTANAGHDFSNRDEDMVETGVPNISVGGPTPSHQDEGAGDGGESVLVGTQSGTEEKASDDTEMEEIPSPVPSTSAQDKGPIDGGEPVVVGTQSGTDGKSTADTEMEENPSGLPATSGQGEEHGAGVESEANVGEEPEIGEDNDRDTSSQAEHTEEPGTSVDAGDVPKVVPECKVDDSVLQGTPSDPPSPFAVVKNVLQELETTASMDLDAANVKEGVLEEQGIVAGVEEQEDSNPGLDEADTTVGTPENIDEPNNDAALEAIAVKIPTPVVPKKVKKQLVYEMDEALPEGFKETTVLVEDVPERTEDSELLIAPGNVPFNPLDKVDASKLELLTNVLDGENVKHTLFGYRKVDNEFFSMLVKQGNWVDNMHLEMLAMLMWHKNGQQMIENRCVVLDSFLLYELTKRAVSFNNCINKQGFKWGQRLYDIANGIHIHREPSLRWIKDVDVVYAPMNWRGDHWVGLAIHLRARNIIVYDAFIDYTRESAAWSKMKPVCEMMPYLVRAMCADVLPQTYSVEPFGYERDLNVAQNPSTGDCGPYAMKFLELLAFGNPMSDLVNIQESDMAIYRTQQKSTSTASARVPLLRSGPRGRDIVYRPDVLQDANIYSLCSDPDDFHAAGHDPNDIHTEGRYRPFFKRCVDAGNPIAIYHEGLRLLTHESDIKGAIVLLHRNVPNHADATLACAILSICDGNAYMGAEYLRMFERNHYSLQSEDTRDMCEELLDEIKKYGLTYNNTYGATFSYPEFRGFNTPPCAMMCYIRSGPFKNTPVDTLRNMVYAVDINSICMDEFMTWPHFIQPDSPFRPYFDILLERGSLCAQYLEGVRLCTNFLTVTHGIALLTSVSPADPYACFAHALFLTTTGSYTEFIPVNAMFWEMIQNFEAATAVGELVMYHISQLHLHGPPLWQRSWRSLAMNE